MTFGVDATFSINGDASHNEKQLIIYFNALTGGLNKYFEKALKIDFGGIEPSVILNQVEYNIDPRLRLKRI